MSAQWVPDAAGTATATTATAAPPVRANRASALRDEVMATTVALRRAAAHQVFAGLRPRAAVRGLRVDPGLPSVTNEP